MEDLAGNLNEYTVPNDARVIIVDGIRVSREYFRMLNDSDNDGKTFELVKSAQGNNGLPVIGIICYSDLLKTIINDDKQVMEYIRNILKYRSPLADHLRLALINKTIIELCNYLVDKHNLEIETLN